MSLRRHSKSTAAELISKLESDADFVARRQAAEQMRSARAARIRIEEEVLLAELRNVGVDVSSCWDLVNSSAPYPKAIPILLRHLRMPYSDVIRDGIARALAVPDPAVRAAWPMLVAEYRNAPLGMGIVAIGDTIKQNFGAKDGLACALAAVVTDETLPELISLLKERSLGDSRLLLLPALKKRRKKSKLAAGAILDLASDPSLREELASWKVR
ncbi:MAG: hypothetical protein KGO53_12575 [Alphaproteobacteria bacterium]|nr:hypothetical protein [Alphaproteobacteria bacterium]